MTQENQGTSSAVPDNVPGKRKRGRPRKDRSQPHGQVPPPQGDVPQSQSMPSTPTPEAENKNQRRKIDSVIDTKNDMVGQSVFGVLDGSFDAGYLLTVRVGDTNTILKGVVFQPGSSVPVSGSNDVAPHIKMLKRAKIHIPEVDLPTQVHGSSVRSVQIDKRTEEPPGRYDGFLQPGPSQAVIEGQAQPQISEEEQNDSKHVNHGEDKTKYSAKLLLAEGHSGDIHGGVLVSSQVIDGKSHTNDVLPLHLQPELKDRSASVTECLKHDETLKQAILPGSKAPSISQVPGEENDCPKSEPYLKRTVDQLPQAEVQTMNSVEPVDAAALDNTATTAAELHLTTGQSVEPLKVLQENQASSTDQAGEEETPPSASTYILEDVNVAETNSSN